MLAMPAPALTLPAPALVALIGVPDAAKQEFAERHFGAAERVGTLEDAETRLRAGLMTAFDAPLIRPDERRTLAGLARRFHLKAVAVVFDLPTTDPAALAQRGELRRTAGGLTQEGFSAVWTLRSAAEVAGARVQRVPLRVLRPELHGPFDLIGDIHGCCEELRELLTRLGYGPNGEPPAGRRAVFLGDLVDRGPDSAGVLRLVMNMVRAGAALWVVGNHDERLGRALAGRAVKVQHGLGETLEQLAAAGPEFSEEVREFLAGGVSHLVLDGGRLVAAHAGLPERFQGRDSPRISRFTLYGDVDGKTDEHGLPVRGDWAADYHGAARVVYGHTPVRCPVWVGHTLNIDTGCVFGGSLTALRYPELELVSVRARAEYARAGRPFLELGG